MIRIAVVIPCYRVTQHVLEVIRLIPPNVSRIYAIDDACPDCSGNWIATQCTDPRVHVLFHEKNQGVGGAVITGYKQAIVDHMDIVVKIDGDGQMNPSLLPLFVRPIKAGLADYTKGNRFFRPESLRSMPTIRLIGNAGLSFLTKLSCGYWSVMDPTNGYTAIHTSLLKELPLDKIEKRYFFETDILFRLNTLRAVVKDVPMDSVYADETSGLSIARVLPEFLSKHIHRLWLRYFYNYFLRDFNIGSIYSLFAISFLSGGLLFGIFHWMKSASSGEPATSGTVMLAALPIFIGMQFLVAFLHHDVSNIPSDPLHPLLTTDISNLDDLQDNSGDTQNQKLINLQDRRDPA